MAARSPDHVIDSLLGRDEGPRHQQAGHGDRDMDQDVEQEEDYDGQEHARPRKRTRRACDKCSSSRTRCDGEFPCRRCKDYGYTCRYNRVVKKRGRLPGGASSATAAAHTHTHAHAHGHSHAHAHARPPSPPPDPAPRSLAPESSGSLSSPSIVSPGMTSAPGSQHAFSPRTTSAPDTMPRPTTTTFHRPGQAHDDVSRHHELPRPMNYARPGGGPAPAPPTRLPSILHGDKYQSLSSFSLSSDHYNAHRAPRTAPPPAGPQDGNAGDSDVPISDESAGYASPLNPIDPCDERHSHYARPPSARSNLRHERNRESLSTSVTAPEVFTPDFQQKAPSDECWYRFLDPVLPYIRNIIPASVACDLLVIFLTDPGSSLFRGASPYILTRIFRKRSVTHPSNPRRTTPALLATILWCVAQTADTLLLQVPGSRAKIVNDLYDLATSLVSERDPDRWRRIHGGLRPEHEVAHPSQRGQATLSALTPANEPAGVIDDVLTFILLSIAVSGGDFKSDCKKWWSKATRLALSLRLNREDEQCSASVSPCANPLCSCRREQNDHSHASIEAREERRRVFWLLYSLDRHLALSFNSALSIPDSYCEVYAPLPEAVWENLDSIPISELPKRVIGPPTVATGTGFLEYFLPLMAILGDIIDVHHRRQHPRLGGLDDTHSVHVIEDLLSKYERSLETLERDQAIKAYSPAALPNLMHPNNPGDGTHQQQHHPYQHPMARSVSDQSKVQLVRAYSTHIVHVLYVLLHGKWDAICMLDDGDDWITSKRFNECASHAISASQSVSTILTIDPELAFMSYLFGIYLLQGSFILLLFADRMPQLGPNESVEQACENIIRAHEVCVVTLSTEFQRNFRKVLRSTLYSVRSAGPTNWEEHKARRRALSLYRWTKGAQGLAL